MAVLKADSVYQLYSHRPRLSWNYIILCPLGDTHRQSSESLFSHRSRPSRLIKPIFAILLVIAPYITSNNEMMPCWRIIMDYCPPGKEVRKRPTCAWTQDEFWSASSVEWQCWYQPDFYQRAVPVSGVSASIHPYMDHGAYPNTRADDAAMSHRVLGADGVEA